MKTPSHTTRQTLHDIRLWALLASVLATLIPQRAALAQGSLTPPGPPGPTMKTLDQIEPRKPVSALPYTISTPGSYYITTNLSGTSGSHGVIVNASDVTIDLCGFALTGVPGSFEGIVVGSQTNVSIRNGTLRSWGSVGVDTFSAANCELERLRSIGNANTGLLVGPASTVRNCVAAGNFRGINTSDGCLVVGCLTQTNFGDTGVVTGSGTVIRDCTSQRNASDGFNARDNCVISGCLSTLNGIYGLAVGNNNLVTGNNVISNGYVGLWFTIGNRIEANNLVGNSAGFYANGTNNLIIRNSARNNGGNDYGGLGGNLLGPIVTSANIATDSNPHSNYRY